MKRLFLGAAFFMTFLFLFGSIASATPVTFTETYLDAPNTQYFRIYEGYRVAFGFNLSATGGVASLFNAQNQLLGTRMPTTDETGYDPLAYETPISAQLTFKIWDWDRDRAFENLVVRAGFHDGNVLLADETYNISGPARGH